ncbi:MFS transporter [Fimbriiglobus ruber]|uniref:Putative nucleoside transporter YegT n=1 Tax=Fimbriiglobus ruber TaxID=1908690 RepID=A0A225DAL8_9BACT|nr:MFS transporter [Fimbriiglobus ruber]OWK38013.1 putative nucleoside transporter YegT [Fimbriiglobus ruber]
MPLLVWPRLSAMMFLFYFSFGSWAIVLSTYLMSAPIKGGLNFSTAEVGWVYSTFAFGGMLAPMLVGLLADRLFRAERVLGTSSLACAGLLAVAGWWCDSNFANVDREYRAAAARETVDGRPVLDLLPELGPPPRAAGRGDPRWGPVRGALDRVNDDAVVRAASAAAFRPLFGVMLAYCFFLQIGLTLLTVITLRTLPDAGRRFSRTRMFGTVGWIVTGNTVGIFLAPISPQPLYLGAAAALATGIYSFTLPATHPKATGRTVAEALGLPALKLFRDRSFGVFIGVGFLATVMNQFYGVYAHRYFTDMGVPRPEMVMTLGQVCEVAVMFMIPVLNPKKRLKWLMAAGLVGWVVRGFAMTFGSMPAAIAFGVPMHGWSYAFYFVVAATYLDREAPPHLRASAQAIVSFVANGFGNWVGNVLAGDVVDAFRTGTVIDWQPVWAVPLVGASVALVAFVLLFQPPPERPAEKSAAP